MGETNGTHQQRFERAVKRLEERGLVNAGFFAPPRTAKSAFSDGKLTKELKITKWTPEGRGEIEWALAREGLSASVPMDADDGGPIVLSPKTVDTASALIRSARALAELRARGYFAEGALAFTEEEAREEIPEAERARCAYWLVSDQLAFDEVGELSAMPLQVRWAGDAKEIAAAFEAHGLVVEPSKDGAPLVVEDRSWVEGQAKLDRAKQLREEVNQRLEKVGWKRVSAAFGDYVIRERGRLTLKAVVAVNPPALSVILAEEGEFIDWSVKVGLGEEVAPLVERIAAAEANLTPDSFTGFAKEFGKASGGGELQGPKLKKEVKV